MSVFECVTKDGVVIGDGGLGTMLQQAGLRQGDVPESWNLTHLAEVQRIHEEYIRAGSRVVETNTFGCNELRLSDDLKGRAEELAQAGAELCRKAVAAASPSRSVLVAGSMGPTGKLPQPLGDLSEETGRRVFCAQARGLLKGGVDFILIETMTSLEEAEFAIKGVLDAAAAATAANGGDGIRAEDVRICVTMSFAVNKRRGLVRTPMGVSPEQLVGMCAKYRPQVFCVGHNCGNGLAEAEKIAGELVKAVKKDGEGKDGKELLVAMQCNAGLPKLGPDGTTVYESAEEDFAKYYEQMKSLGVTYIGGCCGSRPEHIKMLNN